MKYIKLFENMDKLYGDLDSDEWSSIRNLDKSDIFKKITTGESSYLKSNGLVLTERPVSDKGVYQYTRYGCVNNNLYYTIYKVDDDYFYVFLLDYQPGKSDKWKCDGIDGLVQLFKDI